ncbi:MAG: acetoin utilization deacetylase AcuC-like enzyme [Parasphingorhabdus sp.]|jgi:acetoin utilization deacetylase AcuC-like enzyme
MNERLAVFFDEDVLKHDTGSGFFEAAASEYLPIQEKHPENDLRLENMQGMLVNGPLKTSIDWHNAGPASLEQLARFHLSSYIQTLADVPVDQSQAFSGTTIFGPGSFEICRKAAGLAIGAAEHVFSGKNTQAYAMVRPPGHHAQTNMADGYCFFNNIGVAIEQLRNQGLQRAVVIDWDVHHGNGTQQGFYEDADILTISMHMDHGAWGPTHIQTGAVNEYGTGAGIGKNINFPMPYGAGDNSYAAMFKEFIRPAVEDHQPEIIFIAMGQDANQFDPNGRQLLSMQGFHQLGWMARELANNCCDGKLVMVQEGGYAISYAAYCLHATLRGCLHQPNDIADPLAYMNESNQGIDELKSKLYLHPAFSNHK